MANPYFNATYYLKNNPDVFAAGINTAEGAWNHYVTYGAREALEGADSRQPAAWFDAEFYLVNNSDLAIAGLTPGQLFEHFTTHGIREGRAPSADVKLTEANLLAYAKANADLLDAFDIDPDAEELTPTEYEALARQFYQYGYYEDRPAKPVGGGDTPVDNMFFLSPESDYIIGTGGDDQFLAYLSQNPWAGGVSNTLSSGDYLDGVAGYDSLFAEVVPEFFGVTGEYQIDIQPRTKNIEQVEFEAREFGWNEAVVVDAKHMYGVERIGSKQSDGDLVIENLTTLANDGSTKRNTSELTITMDHTGPENSNDNASDLTVYFDNNYLIAGQKTEHNIQLRVVNTYQLAENEDPLMGFLSVTFSVGEQEVVVDIAGSATYQDVADAINARLAELGIEGVQASLAAERTAVFTDDVEEYTQGQLAGFYNPVNIVSTNEELVAGPIELESNIKNFDGLNTWVDGDQVTTEDPISVNIELTKVGRGGEGGDLIIGGKAEHHNADQGIAGGIEVFNVIVKGGDHLPNSLGTLRSTNDALHTVYISSEVLLGQETFASLEIREGFGQWWNGGQDSLTLVDASAFLGDLTLGSEDRIVNLDTLIATGGGDVDYRAISTGGHDTSITTGDGDDDIDVVLAGVSDSGSTPSSAFIDAGDGNNVVEVHSWGPYDHSAVIYTGSGADTIHGNDVSVHVYAGEGDDVIYAENTGDKAQVTLLAGVWSTNAGTETIGSHLVPVSQLLHGRDVQVTLAIPGMADADSFVSGFESKVRIEASDGYLTTERDLYEAVARAINEDEVLNKLAKAEVNSLGNLTVRYLVDGEAAGGDDMVQIEILRGWDDLTGPQKTNILQALKAEYRDSSITEAQAKAAYDATITAQVIEVAGPVATAHTFVVDTTNLTVDGTQNLTFSITGAADGVVNAFDIFNPPATVDIDGETYNITVSGTDLILTSTTLGAFGATPVLTVTDTSAGLETGVFTDGVDGSTTGSDSDPNGGTNVVNGGLDDDVIVLSSDETSTATADIVEFDAGGFGNDTIVHFTTGTGPGADKLDFTDWLDNVTSASGSTESQIRVATELNIGPSAINANDVTVVDFTALNLAAPVTFANMTDAQVLAALNTVGGFSVAATTDLVGNVQKSLLMVQDDDNDGMYKVFEVTSSNTAGSDFTDVKLVGSLDFGETLAGLDVTNFVGA